VGRKGEIIRKGGPFYKEGGIGVEDCSGRSKEVYQGRGQAYLGDSFTTRERYGDFNVGVQNDNSAMREFLGGRGERDGLCIEILPDIWGRSRDIPLRPRRGGREARDMTRRREGLFPNGLHCRGGLIARLERVIESRGGEIGWRGASFWSERGVSLAEGFWVSWEWEA